MIVEGSPCGCDLGRGVHGKRVEKCGGLLHWVGQREVGNDD